MNSIRLRATVLVAVGITALLVVGGATLMPSHPVGADRAVRWSLAARAEACSRFARFDGTKVEMDFAGEAMPRLLAPRRTHAMRAKSEYFVAYGCVMDTRGVCWNARSRSAEQVALVSPNDQSPVPAMSPPCRLAARAGVRDRVRANGSVMEATSARRPPWRADAMAHARAGATPVADSSSLMSRVATRPHARRRPGGTSVPWASPSPLASLLVVRWAVGRGLRPVGDLSRRVQTLGGLAQCAFERGSPPPNSAPIAEQLSGLLSPARRGVRARRNLPRRQYHELRTPIAELHAAGSRPDPPSHQRGGTTQAAENLGVLDRAQALCGNAPAAFPRGRERRPALTRRPRPMSARSSP